MIPIRIYRLPETDERGGATIFEVEFGPKSHITFWDDGPPSFASDSPARSNPSLWHGTWHWGVAEAATLIWGPPEDDESRPRLKPSGSAHAN